MIIMLVLIILTAIRMEHSEFKIYRNIEKLNKTKF